MNLNELTILQAHRGLKKKEFSSQELTKACLREIKKKNREINAFINVLEKESLAQAKEADKKIKIQGVNSLLTGIPLAVKDNILIKDAFCTAGSKILENYRAGYDATVVKKLKKSGAVFLGKTNLDEFAMGSSTESSAFGPTRNPYDLEYVPGGSSGGSAAALAANMCLGALGSDTGGSIRQPAAFCGVVGLKPTYGRVSRYGLIAMASSLDQIGPLVRSVEDAEILLKAIEGRDENDATSYDFSLQEKKSVSKMRIGLPREYFGHGLDPRIKKAILELEEKLRKQGVEFMEVSLPHTSVALACYYILMPAEVSSNLARYDGIRYGFSAGGKSGNLLDFYLESRTRCFGDEAKRRIMLGAYVLSAGYYQKYYLQAQKVRNLVRNDFAEVFKRKGVDCLLTPTSPVLPWKLGEKIDDPLSMYLADVYTVSVNLAGLPAVSLPLGRIQGLPFAGQLIGDYFQEERILRIGKIIETILKE